MHFIPTIPFGAENYTYYSWDMKRLCNVHNDLHVVYGKTRMIKFALDDDTFVLKIKHLIKINTCT